MRSDLEDVEDRVSVILPAYNARPFIGRAIDSVLCQTERRFELLVIDDGSRDGTAEFVAEAYRDERRLEIIRAARNGGPAHARNLGLSAAQAPWIALIDADDAWRPERLERLLAPADASIDMVFDNLLGFDGHLGVETGPIFPSLPASGIGVAELLAPDVEGSALNYGYLKPIVRRQFAKDHAIAYDEQLRTGEDLVFYLDLMLAGARTSTISEASYVYTTPVGQTSGRASDASQSIPNDDQVIEALRAVVKRHALSESDASFRAVQDRIAYLQRIGPVASFFHARQKRQLGLMLSLALRHAAVRDELYRYGRRLLGIEARSADVPVR